MFACLKRVAEWLDTQLRFADLALQRTNGSPINEKLKLSRHPLDAVMWPAVVVGAIWTGMPTIDPHLLVGIGVTFIAFGILLVGARYSFQQQKPVSWDVQFQAVLILGLCVILWSTGPETAQKWRPYRHFLIPVAAIVAVSLLAAPWMVKRFFAPLRESTIYQDFLTKTELFQRRVDEQPADGSVALAVQVLTSAFSRAPLWLLPAAAAALFTPPEIVFVWSVSIGVGVFIILLLAALDERLDQIVSLLSARAFRNAALIVSWAIIALGILRWRKDTYVTTLLDTVAGGEIFLYLSFIYALTWWYDYWLDRLLGQELLQFVSPGETVKSVIPYSLEKGEQDTGVPYDGRVLQIHGIGRFLVYRATNKNARGNEQGFQTRPLWRDPPYPSFHSWSYRDFFYRLAVAGSPGGTQPPLPRQIDQRISQFTVGVGGLVTLLLLAGYLWLSHAVQEPEIVVKTDRPASVSLKELLALHGQARSQQPVILVAASGGGTRAALYTAAALEGLVVAGLGDDILLGSGVSGGGAALAYFASKRTLLTNNDLAPWDTFSTIMGQPFIQDVLERASEGRIIEGGRLGTLLAESFRRRWELAPERDQLGEIRDFGLILNTALAAHLDRSTITGDVKTEPLRQVARLYANQTKPDLAGGRLILTNLAIQDAFQRANLPLDLPKSLPIVIDDKEARLEDASALNANFPPVFSNAAVDVDNQVRYWVTDGGAADNRGMEMLTYALKHALRGTNSQLPCQNLPPIRIVVLDASAFEESFRQDRGIGTALGAGAQFANHLVAELMNSLWDCYAEAKQQNALQFHYVPMPRILREAGSFGTHWTLQDWIRVKHEHVSVTIGGLEMVKVLRALYGHRSSDQLSEAGGKVLEWARASNEYQKWEALIQSSEVLKQ